jgi:plastocyanin
VLTFPTNYKSGVLYNSVDRDDRKEIHLQYTSRAAIEAAEAGKPLPDGAVITSVAYAAALDSKGNPLRDAKGNMVTGSLLRFVVMEKRAGSGAAIPQDLRNGDWQFAAFTADGKHDTDPQAEVKGCMACHKPHDQLDYVKTYLAMSGKRVETNPTPVPMGAIVATVVRLAVTPTRLKVRVGTPVTWINTDDMPHQFIVEGAALKTGYLVKGQAGTVIPNKPGVYSYRDTFLPTVDSLKGLLVVTD